MTTKRTTTNAARKTAKKTKATRKAAPKRSRKKTEPAPKAKKPATESHKRQPIYLTPGTTLPRTFKGEDLKVQVTEDGFEFKGKTFKSISAVARHITGYQISGPVFFGLVETKGREAKS